MVPVEKITDEIRNSGAQILILNDDLTVTKEAY